MADDDATMDVQMGLLRESPGWAPFISHVLEKQLAAQRKLYACQPEDPPEKLHRLLGEVTAYGVVLGTPDSLATAAVKARENDAAARSATRPRQAR